MILKVIVQEAQALRLEAVRLSIWHLMCDYFAIIVEGSKPDLTIIIAQDDQPNWCQIHRGTGTFRMPISINYSRSR